VTRALRSTSEGDARAALHAALTGGDALFAGEPSADLPDRVPQRIALVVQSSGSTGRPKRVALSADALLASAAASESSLGGPGQWVLALPTSYIAGLNVLVRSFAAGTEPAVVAGGSFTAERFVAASAVLDADLRWFTSLVPTQLARLLESPEAAALLRRFDRVLLGGQAAPAPLLRRATDLDVAVTRTYGSSETSGGCIYDGSPIGTTHARIVDGEIQLGGPVLAEGYLDDPERTDAAFLTDDGTRWYRTGDAGVFDNGLLHVSGRLDDVIISGGVKVSLGEIERLVREQPGLEDAVVVRESSAEWGEVPVVVATATSDLSVLKALLVDRLGPAASPSRIVVLDRLPQLASGKPDRLAIRTGLAR
jgi:o-succinylbenzoate---CoA ligase